MKTKTHNMPYPQQLLLLSLFQMTLLKPSLAQPLQAAQLQVPQPQPSVIATLQQLPVSSAQQAPPSSNATDLTHPASNRLGQTHLELAQIKSVAKVSSPDQDAVAFKQWLQQQDPKQLAAYQRYMQQHLKHTPSLFVLTQYAAALPQYCEQLRFDLPEKQHWKPIALSLQLLEKLHAQGMIAHYQVIAVRGFDPDRCVAPPLRHRDHSTHLLSAGVYLKFPPSGRDGQPFSSSMLKHLCQFWKLEGKHYRMGMALYPDQILHLNRNAYQSWGKSPFSDVECHAVMHPESHANTFQKAVAS